ncbi:hypothetical protein QBC35DRAFT_454384 [Podospora australis]|uniref:Uncharacterized protein n=1 Tax=Podospora australis TaxID=1536484 RepID=A0AAN6WNP9_9PEZI|nr:hypothetical protein QBC35DRAFT_454384 [Podospora australis]
MAVITRNGTLVFGFGEVLLACGMIALTLYRAASERKKRDKILLEILTPEQLQRYCQLTGRIHTIQPELDWKMKNQDVETVSD